MLLFFFPQQTIDIFTISFVGEINKSGMYRLSPKTSTDRWNYQAKSQRSVQVEPYSMDIGLLMREMSCKLGCNARMNYHSSNFVIMNSVGRRSEL